MKIDLRFNGLDELRRELPVLVPEKLQKPVILGLSQVAFDEAQRGAGRHNVTGALLQSLFNRPIAGGREVAHDTKRAPQAFFVNAGTKAHVIRPKNKKALRWAGGGKFFFAKQVNHPGYRGDPYIIRAADQAVRQFASIVDRALQEIR